MSEADPATRTDRSPGESPPHAASIPDVLARLGVDPHAGLSSNEAAERRARYGDNRLKEAPGVPAWRRFLAQFSDLVIWILIVAAILSGLMGEWIDTGAIVAIVLLNGILGFVQESRAERALAALQDMSAPAARVVRGGDLMSLPADQLVPGDVIELEAGDRVPADVRLIESFSLAVQESALTGESVPVEKKAREVADAGASLGDRHNMAYSGTVVTGGKARGVVTATGMRTELGRIAELLHTTEREPTPLQRRLAELGRLLVVVCLLLVGVVFALQLWHEPTLRPLLLQGHWWDLVRAEQMGHVFLVAVSLAVAAVPEGLPAVVTLALALGLQRMVKRNALVRRLSSVETLGAVTVICSDKTGTLTRNEMTVREIDCDDGRFQLSGAGYRPEGEFRRGDGDAASRVDDPAALPALATLLEAAAWCNNARLVAPDKEAASWSVVGDPTEGALLVAARKAGIEPGSHADRLHEIPFDSDRKTMSVVVRANGSPVMYSKGAPEALLPRCTAELRGGRSVPLDDARRREIEAVNQEMAGRALRVLALAYREDAGEREEYEEADLVFAGLCGMIDPPREEVKAAIGTCRTAGIRAVMITGDHPATARAIARELTLADDADRVLAGREFDQMDDGALKEQVDQIAVYARVSPEHKLRVVRAWKSRGQIVAMTGDGVNDAPAVKAADIGVAMGITGTDVTKEASSMVLMDDNFTSIVSAVEEGRCIYDNIRNVLQYLLSCNAGEIGLMLAASLLGWQAPLVAIQLLWINLVTDSLPALALSLEKPGPGIMERPPRSANESMLSRSLGLAVILQGILIASVVLTAYWLFGGATAAPGSDELHRAQSAAFCVLVFSELLRSLACRNLKVTLFELGPFGNRPLLGAIALSASLQITIVAIPPLRGIFNTWPHTPTEWLMIGALALTDVTAIEIAKLVLRRFRR